MLTDFNKASCFQDQSKSINSGIMQFSVLLFIIFQNPLRNDLGISSVLNQLKEISNGKLLWDTFHPH